MTDNKQDSFYVESFSGSGGSEYFIVTKHGCTYRTNTHPLGDNRYYLLSKNTILAAAEKIKAGEKVWGIETGMIEMRKPSDSPEEMEKKFLAYYINEFYIAMQEWIYDCTSRYQTVFSKHHGIEYNLEAFCKYRKHSVILELQLKDFYMGQLLYIGEIQSIGDYFTEMPFLRCYCHEWGYEIVPKCDARIPFCSYDDFLKGILRGTYYHNLRVRDFINRQAGHVILPFTMGKCVRSCPKYQSGSQCDDCAL